MDVSNVETEVPSGLETQGLAITLDLNSKKGMPLNDHLGIWLDTMAVPYSGAADLMSYALAPDPGTGSSIKTPLRRSQRLIAQLSARHEAGAITCSQSLPTPTCSDSDRPFRQAPILSPASRPHPYDLNKDGNRAVGGGLFHSRKQRQVERTDPRG